ncbi:MAG: hypothetical protein L6R39_007121 [Caloplaca ligustica]|nr:MAG: hypothetical protein L6R39_007121 [Caloplaca ligustica]
MSGKHRRDEPDEAVSNKRLRFDKRDRLSSLSDELLLVLLSYLPTHDLTRCEQYVFQDATRITSLTQKTFTPLWKAAYYERFVRPRAVRIPGLRETGFLNKSLLYSSKVSKWLEDGPLVTNGRATDWKRQYKLRHNWSRGSCKRTETEIAERPSIPPVLVRLHEGIIVTADSTAGLRAWSTQGNQRLIASLAFSIDCETSAVPTSLAIDVSDRTVGDLLISVGFLDGGFGIFALDRRKGSLAGRYMHAPSTNGTVTAIAFSFPYILTMTEAQLLSLYAFPATQDETPGRSTFQSPRLLSSLRSHTAWPPLSLSIRSSSAGISTSVAYAVPTFMAGWSVGLQELRLADNGTILDSRLATALDEGFVPLRPSNYRNAAQHLGPNGSTHPLRKARLVSPSSARPTSLSYNHPYLLAAHSDNTMTLYVVTSNTQTLSIRPGRQLWGHTSAVSGAHVGDRGKAVSVARSNDLRVWELEAGLAPSASIRRNGWGAAKSVAIRPDRRKDATAENDSIQVGNSTKPHAHAGLEDPTISKGWLAFDEEQVVLLGEKSRGAQALVVYNFA